MSLFSFLMHFPIYLSKNEFSHIFGIFGNRYIGGSFAYEKRSIRIDEETDLHHLRLIGHWVSIGRARPSLSFDWQRSFKTQSLLVRLRRFARDVSYLLWLHHQQFLQALLRDGRKALPGRRAS